MDTFEHPNIEKYNFEKSKFEKSYFEKNNFINFSEWIEKLIKLNLDGNQLTIVPTTLGSLTLLRDLSIGRNKVASVQEDCLCNLVNLVMLDLHQNNLRDFSAVPRSDKLDTISLS